MQQGFEHTGFHHGLGTAGYALIVKGIGGEAAGKQRIVHKRYAGRGDGFAFPPIEQGHALLRVFSGEDAAEGF